MLENIFKNYNVKDILVTAILISVCLASASTSIIIIKWIGGLLSYSVLFKILVTSIYIILFSSFFIKKYG